MNLPVSALAPALEAPDEDAVLDEVLAQLATAIEVFDLDHLDRFPANTVLSVLSKTAALNRGLEAILTAASNQVAVRSDPVLGSEGLAARLNYARPSLLIEQVAGVSAATASKWVRVGARTSPRVKVGQPLPPLFPHVAAALRSGSIGVETAEAITKELSAAAPRAEVEHLDAAEQILVGQATGASDSHGVPVPPDLVGLQARQWRDRLDENGIEPRAEKAFHDRDFWISRTVRNGVMKFGGQVTPDVGGKLHALFDAILNPRTDPRYLPTDAPDTVRSTGDATLDLPDHTASSDTGSPSRAADGTGSDPAPVGRLRETRTPGQQRADVFAAMIDSLARSSDAPTVSGASPTVVVRVTADVLSTKRGTGEIVGVPEPIPYSAVQQTLCDSSIIPAYLRPDGGLLALGNEKRGFGREQRLGMIARDGPTCIIDDCQIPASGCEAHHIIEYQDGGPTHVDNGVNR
ncbi:DUF222 domain-containing protein [Mycetocola sp.]|uniref:HNH endonuclease signature motif containing protein n=1 Tax=Mycetocola sp. TaxID=1871042 RepID=UPI003989CAF5